ncbi:MAG TPA: DinB family protein [Blastocatellia bacterium]|nr:DinB family protein [Blastocatellia bacterium]
MPETNRIADQLQRAYAGPAWHGPALLEALSGITAQQAFAQPIRNAHSIWQLVLHLAAWMDAVRERIENGPVREPADGDWPEITDESEGGWQATLALLEQRHQALLSVVANLTDEQLKRRLGDANDPPSASGYSAYYNLHGVIQHNLYHTGQIMLLKKLLQENQ